MMGPREIIDPIINEFNGERLPARHQLDASILYNFYPKNRGNWTGKIGLSLFNIYNLLFMTIWICLLLVKVLSLRLK